MVCRDPLHVARERVGRVHPRLHSGKRTRIEAVIDDEAEDTNAGNAIRPGRVQGDPASSGVVRQSAYTMSMTDGWKNSLPPPRVDDDQPTLQFVIDIWMDLVMAHGFISHLEQFWESPRFARLFRQLGSFARVITFDKRGTGLSDRTAELADIDRRMLDLCAVVGAVGSERPSTFGMSARSP